MRMVRNLVKKCETERDIQNVCIPVDHCTVTAVSVSVISTLYISVTFVTHTFRCYICHTHFQVLHLSHTLSGVTFVTHTFRCYTCYLLSGVLLLNACLTVRAHQANSHAGKGWEQFTDATISWLNKNSTGIVFMLWGAYAQKKGACIDKVCTLEMCSDLGRHASPFSGFYYGLYVMTDGRR